MTKIKHEIVIDVEKLRYEIIHRIHDIESAGFRVKAVLFHPKTVSDILLSPSSSILALSMPYNFGISLCGVNSIISKDMKELEYYLVIE